MVAQALAVSTGSRSARLATFMPNFRRRLPPASAAMTLMHSSWGSRLIIRSLCQMESTPPASHRSTQRQKSGAAWNGKLAMPSPALTVMSQSWIGREEDYSGPGRWPGN